GKIIYTYLSSFQCTRQFDWQSLAFCFIISQSLDYLPLVSALALVHDSLTNKRFQFKLLLKYGGD
ncbi:hypothetical protein, partial [Staphylococcus microti]|uniref:hypothetical protein n=1 Tax=Staphylococcus microti TaxID=569857 RepID=UPI00197DF610